METYHQKNLVFHPDIYVISGLQLINEPNSLAKSLKLTLFNISFRIADIAAHLPKL